MITSNQIMEWAEQNPLRDGESWSGWDGSLLFRLGVAPPTPSVSDLARQHLPLNPIMADAPVGAIHFFDLEPYGHAGVDVYGGGSRILTTGLGPAPILGHGEFMAAEFGYLGWAVCA